MRVWVVRGCSCQRRGVFWDVLWSHRQPFVHGCCMRCMWAGAAAVVRRAVRRRRTCGAAMLHWHFSAPGQGDLGACSQWEGGPGKLRSGWSHRR